MTTINAQDPEIYQPGNPNEERLQQKGMGKFVLIISNLGIYSKNTMK